MYLSGSVGSCLYEYESAAERVPKPIKVSEAVHQGEAFLAHGQ